jgi:hypothetical protein
MFLAIYSCKLCLLQNKLQQPLLFVVFKAIFSEQPNQAYFERAISYDHKRYIKLDPKAKVKIIITVIYSCQETSHSKA